MNSIETACVYLEIFERRLRGEEPCINFGHGVKGQGQLSYSIYNFFSILQTAVLVQSSSHD